MESTDRRSDQAHEQSGKYELRRTDVRTEFLISRESAWVLPSHFGPPPEDNGDKPNKAVDSTLNSGLVEFRFGS